MTRILHTKAIYISIALGALFGVLFLLSREMGPRVIVGPHTIPVVLADTPALRTQGLSGTERLAPGTGMLFVFDTPGVYGFWMKDMRYPLDIVWIDERFMVTDITYNLDPATYPTVVAPSEQVQYVLELNAGESADLGIDQGTYVHLEK
ncbi:MAG: DUF192 domain-containing protein [Candidatus Pacebacteria bacterium]|nr:DUF192 domain-containing protein [Candidatus Paceibacterota bacterium]MBP9700918.1 DUF192 domain-containing protein [Candidatus Paceibacterota bacterium]